MSYSKAAMENQEPHTLAERFIIRAQTVFYIRLALVSLSLGVLCVPFLHEKVFGTFSWSTIAITGVVAIGIIVARIWSCHPTVGRWINFITLTIDLAWIIYIIAQTNGIMSPLMAVMPIYAMMFALLFNNPLTILPPLIVLPIVSGIDVFLAPNGSLTLHFLAVLYYGLLNGACVYVTSYNFAIEESQSRRIFKLQEKLKVLAIAEQRAHIAREIHDGLGANVSSLAIQCEYLLTIPELSDSVRAEIVELKKSAEDSIGELRQAISVMRGEFELLEQIKKYCLNYSIRHRIEAEVKLIGDLPAQSTEVKLAIFRIVQESLTNSAKHARASKIVVSLISQEERFSVTIQDNGVGFIPRGANEHHYGMINLRERARKISADLNVRSEIDRGTIVSLVFGHNTVEASQEMAA